MIIKQDAMNIKLYQNDMRQFKLSHKALTPDAIQKVIKITWMRFTVTICLYLNLNNMARSLSTLMAVIVNRDTEHNT